MFPGLHAPRDFITPACLCMHTYARNHSNLKFSFQNPRSATASSDRVFQSKITLMKTEYQKAFTFG